MTELIPQESLKKLVEQADLAAVENVRAGRGGPFGASLHVLDLQSGAIIQIGDIAGNAVLQSGVGSAHAEDQALSPENIQTLKSHLRQNDPAQSVVIVASSGESCPACHAKIEILARILLHEELIAPGHFVVAYGASYADTYAVAGFNDEPYHADMTKAEDQRLIAIQDSDATALPAPVQKALQQADAVVVMPDKVFTGVDQRIIHYTFTPEVVALRAAANAQKQQGHPTPWDLGRATLYTKAQKIGPLCYAEAQWANIGAIIRVRTEQQISEEAPATANDALFRAIATRPYNNPHSVLRVTRITPFANLGQQEWARLQQDNPALKNYNGVTT